MSYFEDNKINMEDYEGLNYPDLDNKRAIIDKMLADKINEIFRILDDMERRIQ
jgi:hypothetical protein